MRSNNVNSTTEVVLAITDYVINYFYNSDSPKDITYIEKLFQPCDYLYL